MVNYKRIIFAGLAGLMPLMQSFAGNDTKRGQAGAVELLINPWARSAGMAGSNSGIIRGIESMGLNVAGLSAVRKTEFNFCSSLYLVGSDVRVNSLGFGTKVGEGVMGLTLSSFNLGDFYETTVENPDGTGIIFSPQIFNFGAAYSKNFSKRISAGLLVRGTSQSAYSASVFGLAFDAGIQYQTGPRKEFKFGVSLLNLGPKISFGGDAFTGRGTLQGTSYSQTVGLLPAAFEQPSMLNIGVGYDFYVENESMQVKLTPCFNFRSNSFTSDQYMVGIQAGLNERFMLRAGYDYQDGVFTEAEATNANLGPSFGASVQIPFVRTKSGEMAANNEDLNEGAVKSKVFGFDYSYTTTRYFGGTHRFALILSL
jgi:hypothetical protein